MTCSQITIDGPAASGKSSVARLVAEHLRALCVNTGDMYRTIAWAALQRGIDVAADRDAVVRMLDSLELGCDISDRGTLTLSLGRKPIRQEDIRRPDVARVVSLVARIPEVRAWLRSRQREIARHGTVVMEGRDIGTVILPEAAHKFFLTASPEIRARRRLAQADEAPPGATVSSVAAEIAERDRIDSTRETAPLRPAADAVIIETDELTAEQVAARIVDHVTRGDATS